MYITLILLDSVVNFFYEALVEKVVFEEAAGLSLVIIMIKEKCEKWLQIIIFVKFRSRVFHWRTKKAHGPERGHTE